MEELEALTWELEKELDNPLLFDTENLSLTEVSKLQTVLENFSKFSEEEFLKIINKK